MCVGGGCADSDGKERCTAHATTTTHTGDSVQEPSGAPTTNADDGGVQERLCIDDVKERRVYGTATSGGGGGADDDV